MDRDLGLGPPWTTWWRGLEATRARWCAHRSLAFGRSRAQKLASEGQARRGEDGVAGAALTRARVAVRRPGDDSKAVAAEELGGGGARAQRGEEDSGDGCVEDRARASAFYRGPRVASARDTMAGYQCLALNTPITQSEGGVLRPS
jgi:hypothetical protein